MSDALQSLVTDQTPAVADLLEYWRVVTPRGKACPFDADRSAAILLHIDRLEHTICELTEQVEQQTGTIMWNRERHDEALKAMRERYEAQLVDLRSGSA